MEILPLHRKIDSPTSTNTLNLAKMTVFGTAVGVQRGVKKEEEGRGTLMRQNHHGEGG